MVEIESLLIIIVSFLTPIARVSATFETVLVPEVRPGHGLFFDHICLMVLIVVPEGLLELLRDVFHDILLSLRLRRHYHGSHLAEYLLAVDYFTGCLLFFDKLALRLW